VSVRSRCEQKSQDDVENRKLASGSSLPAGEGVAAFYSASVLVLLWPLWVLGSGSSAFALPLSSVASCLRFFVTLLMALFIAAVSEHSAVLCRRSGWGSFFL
jgi:hypothetical protein